MDFAPPVFGRFLPFVIRLVSKPDRLVVILQRALYVAFVAPNIASVVESGGKVGLAPDRLVEILQRALYVAFVAPRITTVIKGVGMVRFEPDRLAEILQRALHVAFGTPGNGPFVEGGGSVRLEPARLVVKAQPFIKVKFQQRYQMRHRNSRSEDLCRGVASAVYEPVGSAPSPPHSLSAG